MRAIDLFCGGGGAARGLVAAGFEVVGIDSGARGPWRSMAREYPGEFILGDALRPPVRLEDFDLVWASPPCQAYAIACNPLVGRPEPDDTIASVRELLAPHPVTVIENVLRAPIRADVVLHGAQFDLPLHRRRAFEISFPAPLALHRTHVGKTTNGEIATVVGSGGNGGWVVRERKRLRWRELPESLRRRLSERNSVVGWRDAMGVPEGEMTGRQLAEAVPPAYAEFLGQAAREWLSR